MSKIAIVTDSTVTLPKRYVDEYNISVAPQIVIWDGKEYQDGVDIQPEAFYTRLENSKTSPSSSQVPIPILTDIYKKLLDDGFEILSIHISSKLSGTMNSAEQAKAVYPGAPIELVDSLSASMAMGFHVLQAARAAQNGASLKECKAVAVRAQSMSNVFFAVDTLEYLHRGGRIGGAARFLGTALNLKPILTLVDGKVEAVTKVRTQKKSIEKLFDMVEEGLAQSRLNRISVLHANVNTLAVEVLEECKRRFNPTEAILTEVSPAIGTHTGPGTIGIAYLRDM